MVADYALVEGQPADTPFARFLYDVMTRRGASQNAIHAATGISASAVGDWVYKGIEPKTRSLEKLAPWLHMEVRELWAIIHGEITPEDAVARYTDAYAEIDAEMDAWIAQGERIRDRIRRLRGGL
jgi:transcriptional regulator with XRE-family HTH domain